MKAKPSREMALIGETHSLSDGGQRELPLSYQVLRLADSALFNIHNG
jgi:hypothetical protein